MLTGHCHCGKVTYAYEGTPLRFVYCHCDDCRAISGSPFSSALVLESKGFHITTGEEHLAAYESSKGKYRKFCRHCGSAVYASMEYKPDVFIIRAGTLDPGHGLTPQMHIWVSAKVPWYKIEDNLPQHFEMAT